MILSPVAAASQGRPLAKCCLEGVLPLIRNGDELVTQCSTGVIQWRPGAGQELTSLHQFLRIENHIAIASATVATMRRSHAHKLAQIVSFVKISISIPNNVLFQVRTLGYALYAVSCFRVSLTESFKSSSNAMPKPIFSWFFLFFWYFSVLFHWFCKSLDRPLRKAFLSSIQNNRIHWILQNIPFISLNIMNSIRNALATIDSLF